MTCAAVSRFSVSFMFLHCFDFKMLHGLRLFGQYSNRHGKKIDANPMQMLPNTTIFQGLALGLALVGLGLGWVRDGSQLVCKAF